MRLKRFHARDVYGYLDFEIDFFRDLSFLVGVNGSGKTTVLRLMQALLTPSISDLIVIPFSKASVTFEDRGQATEISCRKDEKQTTIKVSSVDEALTLPAMDTDELEFLIANESPRADFLSETQLKYADHAVFQTISNINAPVFLGLERTHKGQSDVSHDRMMIEERWISTNARRKLRGKRIVHGSLAAGLMETQALVQEAYKRLRRVEVRHADRLRESMLLSAFTYSDFSSFSIEDERMVPDWMEKRQIQDRRTEIEIALTNVGLSGDKIKTELGTFFSRLNNLIDSLNATEDKGLPIELIINKAQIDRVSDLIKIIDENKSNIDKLYAPINMFLETINSFYADTRKSVQIDTVGQLSILRPDKEVAPIEALSSGERQLLIIFAHLMFNEYGSRSNVFIIDEPELSLHLRWQERFVSRALEISPDTQLILATHSPEIVSEFHNHSVSV